MFLSRIHLDPRCREVRRDLSDPYQLHSTLCRAFSVPERRCPEGEFLWRTEPENAAAGYPRVLVQSRTLPDWNGIAVPGWLAKADSTLDLEDRLGPDLITAGRRCRFRLRANPSVCRNGKRQGLLRLAEQEEWIRRKGVLHGFSLPRLASFDLFDPAERIDVRVSREQLLIGNRRAGSSIRVFSVLYEGMLTITDPDLFKAALRTGIGHGKVMGLGLLSIVPVLQMRE